MDESRAEHHSVDAAASNPPAAPQPPTPGAAAAYSQPPPLPATPWDIQGPTRSRPPLPPPERPDPRLYGERRSKAWLIGVVAGVAGAALTAAAIFAFGGFAPSRTHSAPLPLPVAEPAFTVTPSDGQTRVAAIAATAIPSIVAIEVTPDGGADFPLGTGSGVVFTSDGHILTNHHVIEGGGDVRIVFADGRVYTAELIGSDPLTDLAVMKIAVTGLQPIVFAPIDEIGIGDLAVAVGNPLGLEGGPSVTSGVVSAFGRQLTVGPADQLFGLIQTDAPITRGSSGGALLDEQARLIGITTAIGVSDVGAEGLGFAVPIDIVERVASDLIAGGEVRHAFLGLEGTDFVRLGADGAEVPAGAEIRALPRPSAIGSAGAREGDVIVAVDGSPVRTMSELVAILRTYRADEVVQVEISRDGTPLTFEVRLDRKPENS